jgi:hypothetical protein
MNCLGILRQFLPALRLSLADAELSGDAWVLGRQGGDCTSASQASHASRSGPGGNRSSIARRTVRAALSMSFMTGA